MSMSCGSAGAQHACAVADSLGIRTVLVPPMAGVLSALGIGLADTTAMREQSVEQPLSTASRLTEVADALDATTRAELAGQGVERVRVIRRAHLRYDGTDTAVPVELADPPAMTAAFEAKYRQTYSFLLDRPVIVEAVSVEATGLSEQTDLPPLRQAIGSPARQVRLYAAGTWRNATLHERAALTPGDTIIC